MSEGPQGKFHSSFFSGFFYPPEIQVDSELEDMSTGGTSCGHKLPVSGRGVAHIVRSFQMRLP